jgi:glutaredoxin
MDPFAAIRGELQRARLDVYVSTWCWDCRRLKSYLSRHGIDFTAVNISHDQDAAERLENATGKRGVPFVLVNGAHWVAGYHTGEAGKFNEQRFVEELGAALTRG